MKHWYLAVALICFGSTAHAAGASGILNLQIVKPITLAQLPPGSPPPSEPSQPIQTVAKAAGYLPPSLDWKITSDFSIGISTGIGDFYVTGVRDYNNGQWLSGWGKELFPIKYKGREVAFIAAQNVFNADEGGKGALGGTVGCRPVNLINSVAEGFGAAGELIPLSPWMKTTSNFVSIEAGYAYRLQNVPGVSRNVATLGGQLRVPFDLVKGL